MTALPSVESPCSLEYPALVIQDCPGVLIGTIGFEQMDLEPSSLRRRHTEVVHCRRWPCVWKRLLFDENLAPPGGKILDHEEIARQRHFSLGGMQQPFPLLDQLVMPIGNIGKDDLSQPKMLSAEPNFLGNPLASLSLDDGILCCVSLDAGRLIPVRSFHFLTQIRVSL